MRRLRFLDEALHDEVHGVLTVTTCSPRRLTAVLSGRLSIILAASPGTADARPVQNRRWVVVGSEVRRP